MAGIHFISEAEGVREDVLQDEKRDRKDEGKPGLGSVIAHRG